MNETIIFTLLVWNVHGLPCRFLTGGANPAYVAQYLEYAALDYDILFAQEVWTNGMKKVLHTRDYQHWAKSAGLLTVTPSYLVNRVKHYSFERTSFSKFDFLASKGFNILTVRTRKHNVLFINTHLDSGRDADSELVRLTQVERIINYTKEHYGPIVIVGDLNLKIDKSKQDQRTLNRLTSKLNLRVAVRNKLDYILISKNLPPIRNIKVLPKGPSDHQPILIKLIIDENGKYNFK